MPIQGSNAVHIVHVHPQSTGAERVFIRSLDLIEAVALAHMLKTHPPVKQANGYAVSPELFKNIESGLTQYAKALNRRFSAAKTAEELHGIQADIVKTLSDLGDDEFPECAQSLRDLNAKVDERLNKLAAGDKFEGSSGPTTTTKTVGTNKKKTATKNPLTALYKPPVTPTKPSKDL